MNNLAVKSFIGLLQFFLLFAAIIRRLLEKEKFLEKNLAGYASYRQKVRYRLIPFIW